MQSISWKKLVPVLTIVLLIVVVMTWKWFYTISVIVGDAFMVSVPSETPIVLVSIGDSSLKEVGRWPWPRDVHAALIERIDSFGPKVIGYDITFADKTDEDERFITTVANTSNIVFPINSQIAGGIKAHVQVEVDRDGKVREVDTMKDTVQAFTVALARLLGISQFPEKLRINYNFKKDEWPHVEAADILSGEAGEELRDKVVLVGVTAVDLQDIRDTPLGLMNGVEVHANALYSILSESYVHELAPGWELLVGILLGLIPYFLVRWLSYKKSLVLIFLLLIGVFVVVLVVFGIWFYLLPQFYWSLAIIIGLSISVVYKSFAISYQSRFIAKAFSQYVTPHILEELKRNPDSLRLKGDLMEVTVMFLDIRGFTTYSEHHEPKEVVEKLNELLEEATEIILKHNGTVDKYIGDCIMAFWGAPLPDTLQASNACVAALKINEQVNAGGEFKVGIGLNSGSAVIGNIGSSKRFDYTAIGDTVNTAARLESSTKELKSSIVVSEAVKNKVEREKKSIKNKERAVMSLVFKDLGTVMVKGKTAAIKVWRVG